MINDEEEKVFAEIANVIRNITNAPGKKPLTVEESDLLIEKILNMAKDSETHEFE